MHEWFKSFYTAYQVLDDTTTTFNKIAVMYNPVIYSSNQCSPRLSPMVLQTKRLVFFWIVLLLLVVPLVIAVIAVIAVMRVIVPFWNWCGAATRHSWAATTFARTWNNDSIHNGIHNGNIRCSVKVSTCYMTCISTDNSQVYTIFDSFYIDVCKGMIWYVQLVVINLKMMKTPPYYDD